MSKLFIFILIFAVLVSFLTQKWMHGVLIVIIFAVLKVIFNLLTVDRA